MMHDEPEPVTLALLDDMETELARSSTVTLAAAPADTRVLPVDVTLPPATIIRAGVKLSTLIHALEVRGMAPAAPADGLHSQLARRDADAQHRRNFGEEK